MILIFLLFKERAIMLQFLLTISDESNHEKIERIFKMYHDFMIKYAFSKFNSMGRKNALYDAEDAVQNTFVKIVKYINAIDFSKGEKVVKGYVFSILNNEVCNILRDQEINVELPKEFVFKTESLFIEKLDINTRYNDVVKAIERLDEKYSSTLYLVFCQNKTPKEIAEMMGISCKTVYTRLSRGKILLIDSLKGVTHDEK